MDEIVKTCVCGRRYDKEQWEALPTVFEGWKKCSRCDGRIFLRWPVRDLPRRLGAPVQVSRVKLVGGVH